MSEILSSKGYSEAKGEPATILPNEESGVSRLLSEVQNGVKQTIHSAEAHPWQSLGGAALGLALLYATKGRAISNIEGEAVLGKEATEQASNSYRLLREGQEPLAIRTETQTQSLPPLTFEQSGPGEITRGRIDFNLGAWEATYIPPVDGEKLFELAKGKLPEFLPPKGP